MWGDKLIKDHSESITKNLWMAVCGSLAASNSLRKPHCMSHFQQRLMNELVDGIRESLGSLTSPPCLMTIRALYDVARKYREAERWVCHAMEVMPDVIARTITVSDDSTVLKLWVISRLQCVSFQWTRLVAAAEDGEVAIPSTMAYQKATGESSANSLHCNPLEAPLYSKCPENHSSLTFLRPIGHQLFELIVSIESNKIYGNDIRMAREIATSVRTICQNIMNVADCSSTCLGQHLLGQKVFHTFSVARENIRRAAEGEDEILANALCHAGGLEKEIDSEEVLQVCAERIVHEAGGTSPCQSIVQMVSSVHKAASQILAKVSPGEGSWSFLNLLVRSLVVGCAYRLLRHIRREVALGRDDWRSVLPPDELFQADKWDPLLDRFEPLICEEAPCYALVAARYRLIYPLGRGAFGRGWHAIDLTNKSPVFLKTFRSSLDVESKTITLEEREAAVASELALTERMMSAGSLMSCPYITTVKALLRGVTFYSPLNGKLSKSFNCVVTELGRDGSLSSYLGHENSLGSFPEQLAQFWFGQLALILQSLHLPKDSSERYFHGDIKAENLVVSLAPHSLLQLFDFGSCIRVTQNVVAPPPTLAAEIDPNRKSSLRNFKVRSKSDIADVKFIHMTAAYGFPRSRVNDPASAEAIDVWSVGLILLAMLTSGEFPGTCACRQRKIENAEGDGEVCIFRWLLQPLRNLQKQVGFQTQLACSSRHPQTVLPWAPAARYGRCGGNSRRHFG